MTALFSIKLWLILIGRILKAAHPLTFALALFQLYSSRNRWRSLLTDPSVRLLFIFFLVDFGIRLLMFFSGVKYQTRYFLTTTIVLIALAGAGAVNLAELVATKSRWNPLLRPPRPLAIILLIILAANAGLALIPRWDSQWFVAIPQLIKTSCPAGQKPVLLSMSPDPRFAYYADAEFLKLSQEQDLSAKARLFLADASGKMVVVNKDELAKGLELKGGTALIIIFNQPPIVGRIELDLPSRQGAFSVYGQPYNKWLSTVRSEAALDRSAPPPPNDETWRRLYEGDSALTSIPFCRYQAFKIAPMGEEARLTVKGVGVFEKTSWTVCHISLVGKDFWNNWTPVETLRAGSEHLEENIRKLGGANVFVLTTIEDARFREMLAAHNAPSHLVLLKGFRDNRNRPLCLYQGTGNTIAE